MIAARLVTHSLRAIGRYKLRSTLMMLGTLVGVAALTLVLSVGAGAQRKMLSTVRQLFGDSSVIIMAGGTHLLGGPRPNAARLTIDDVEGVVREVPEVVAWDPQQVLSGSSVRRGAVTITPRVLGESERWPQVWERRVVSGATFDAAEVAGAARVAVIGRTVVRKLFPAGDPVGAEILVNSVPLRIVGVLETFGTDLHGMDRDNEIVVPITTLQRRIMNVDTIAAAKLIVNDAARVEATARDVTRLLRARHARAAGQPDDFTLITAVEVQRMVAGVQRVLQLYLPLVAGVALLVGGVITAALMLASVTARRAEIGLRRAIGARPGDIGLQFLIETAATTLIGGALGIVVGYFGAHVASHALRLGDIFSWSAVLLGLLVSTVVGLAAGLLPARRAARQHPVDALR